MEVSNQEMEPGGEELIQTVVNLSGLPESLAQNEMDRILELSGQNSNNLTLDQLRQAMIAYLESMHEEFAASEANLVSVPSIEE